MTHLPRWQYVVWVLLVAFGGMLGPANAREPVLKIGELEATGQVVLGRYLGHIEDATGAQGIAWASDPARADAYVTSQIGYPNLGYSSSAHWFRFTIDPAGDKAGLLVQLAAPTLDDVQFFSPQPGGSFSVQAAGDRQPWAARSTPHRHFLFRLDLSQGIPTTFYVRVASSSLVSAPLIVWRPAQFEIADSRATLILGMFYGALLALFLYNLVLYFSLRDRAYLLYVCYLAAFGFALSVFDGLAFQYLWPESVVWANRALATTLLATMALGANFSQAFLGAENLSPLSRRVNSVYMAACWSLTLLAAAGWILEPRHFSLAITALSLLGVPIVLWDALSAIFKGYRPARYFLLAWSALLFFMTIAALRNLGLVSINAFSVYGLHFGLVFDVILLSTALADRVRTLREGMIDAQSRLIDAGKHYQEVLERRAMELAAANRELEEFSHTVAHDLRSPLRAIDGFSHLIQEEANDKLGPDAQRDLGLISSNARKMAGLIDGLLDFSRIGRRTPDEQPVNMQELAIAVVKDAAHEGVDIRIGKLDPVRGDALLLKQALTNLIENAIKFSAKNPSPEVSVECTRSENDIIYSVRDNGAGFDMQYADKLFGMFQRLHAPNEFEGTGVGLAIVKRVMERHGGRVWAASTPGAGATFYFALPIGRLAENP